MKIIKKDTIETNKKYGQLEKLEAKVNILFSLLLTQLKKESIEKALIDFANNEHPNNSYDIKEDNDT